MSARVGYWLLRHRGSLPTALGCAFLRKSMRGFVASLEWGQA